MEAGMQKFAGPWLDRPSTAGGKHAHTFRLHSWCKMVAMRLINFRAQILASVVIAICLLLITMLQPLPIRSLVPDLGLAQGEGLAPLNCRDGSSGAATGGVRAEDWPGSGIPGPPTNGIKRRFRAHGNAAALFVQMSAYRGGPTTFAVVGLASKPAQVFGNASFDCAWLPAGAEGEGSGASVAAIPGTSRKMLPDWGFGRAYTVVVVNCTFPGAGVGVDGAGGQLLITASYGEGDPRPPVKFSAMTEAAGEYRAEFFLPPYKYDHLYCGSSLFGRLSPERVREWLAYHTRLFGPRSHFVLYDAGGVHTGVWKVVEPWVKQGRVTVHDVRDQEVFDGYYHNQFLVLNDCLFRTKFLANWTYFFDLDEYLYVDPSLSLDGAMQRYFKSTQVFFEQIPMGAQLCKRDDNHTRTASREEWAMEKLVYKSLKKIRRMRKYAVQARQVYSAGVHLTQDLDGQSTLAKVSQIRFYHYHGTITKQGELCINYTDVVNPKQTTWVDKEPFRYDDSMAFLVPSVKEFEERTIGTQPYVGFEDQTTGTGAFMESEELTIGTKASVE